MTRRRRWLTISSSWVAMTIVVPPSLIRWSTARISREVLGSRLPVGSSARISAGCMIVVQWAQKYRRADIVGATVAGFHHAWSPAGDDDELAVVDQTDTFGPGGATGTRTAVHFYTEGVYQTNFEQVTLPRMYSDVIAGIREVDTDKWIWVEPRSFGVNQGLPSNLPKIEDPRAGEPRIAYFPHLYTPEIDLAGKYAGDTTFFDIRATNRTREQERLDAPMAIGEFGLSLDTGSLHSTTPMSYPDMIASIAGAAGVVTDSGGLQKEAFLVRTPCTTVRTETEWTETVDLGWNVLATDLSALPALVTRSRPAETASAPYGDGHAATRVVEVLAQRIA